MCRRVTCRNCKKYTWSGCGQHVNQVMSGIPKDQRCTCAGKSGPAPKAPKSEAGAKPGFFSRLLGK